MKKRLFIIVLTLVVLFAALTLTASAATEVASGTCGDNLIWALDSDGVLTISGEGAMEDFVSYDSTPWRANNSLVTKVVIAEGVTTIGDHSFSFCRNLVEIAIPDSMTKIGSMAFYYCKSLQSITLPASVTSIEENSFRDCQSVEFFAVDSESTSFSVEGGVLFSKDFSVLIKYPAGLNNDIYYVPENVTTISNYAFTNCCAGKIIFQGNAPSCGDTSFYTCSATVYYPANNTTWTEDVIGSFESKASLYADTYSGSCGDNVAWKLDMLTNTLVISGAGNMENYVYVDDMPWHAYYSHIKTLVVQDGVTHVGNNAFVNYSALCNVSLAETVTEIGSGAFCGCSELNEITLPASLVIIGNDAFHGAGFENITIPDSVTDVGIGAFANCGELRNVIFGKSVELIDGAAFACNVLSSVVFSGSVPTMNDEAFISATATCYYPCDDESWTKDVLQNYGGTLTWVQNHSFVDDTCEHCGLITGTCGDNLTWVLDSDGVLTISGEGAMTKYSLLGVPWYSYKGQITQGVIEYGVTSISDFAFFDCVNMTAVSIPDSVTEIANFVFTNCSTLTSVTIPDSVTTIGGCSFDACTGLTSVFFEGFAPDIDEEAFADVTATIYYPCNDDTWTEDVLQNYSGTLTWEKNHSFVDGVCEHCGLITGTCGENLTWTLDEDGALTISGTGAMADYEGGGDLAAPWYPYRNQIEYVVIEEGVTSIGGYAFASCEALTSIVISESVTGIGGSAFDYCTGLTSIVIPENVASIGSGAFHGCKKLASVNIPADVKEIESYMFQHCTGLTSIIIPDGVTSIGEGAFSCCSALTSVTFEGSAPSIDADLLFKAVTTTVYYPCDDDSWTEDVLQNYGGTLTWAKKHSFVDDTCEVCGLITGTCGDNLTWVLDSDGMLIISGEGEMTYSSSSSAPWYSYREQIAQAVIEDGVTSICDNAFYFCKNLASVAIPNSVTSIGKTAFYDCGSLKSVTIPDSVTEISYGAFARCSSLESVDLPTNLVEVEAHLFCDCTSLASITIPETVTAIGERAFYNCSQLSSIFIPADVISIGEETFGNCTSMESITVDSENTAFSSSDGVLYDKTMSTLIRCPAGKSGSLTIPDSVTAIGRFACNNAVYITEVIIDGDVLTVGDSAFYGCSDLEEITLPGSVTEIGFGSFASCSSLKSVTFTGNAPSVASTAFQNTAITAYYPCNDDSWSDDVLQNYDGTLTWVKNHSKVVDAAVEATCTEDGLTEGSHCSICNDVFVAQEVIPAGHSFVDNVCEHCGLITGTCGDNLIWTLDTNGVLTISGEGEMWHYVDEYREWMEFQSSIKKLVVEEGATSIGSEAFLNCWNLKEISFPETLETISYRAFENCSALQSVELPGSLHTIGQTAFKWTNLSNLVIPEGVVTIGDEAFYELGNLKTLSLPATLETIGQRAFAYGWINTVTFHGNAPAIADYAFENITATCYYPCDDDSWTDDVLQNYGGTLTWVKNHSEDEAVIENEVDSDCENAGSYDNVVYCTICGDELSRETIVVDAGHSFVDNVCEDCGLITGTCGGNLIWTLDTNGLLTISGEGAMWDYSYDSRAPWMDYEEDILDVVLEKDVTTIGNFAFFECNNLISVTIPCGVTSIGYNAFWGSGKLIAVTIPESVTYIGPSAFQGCDNLTAIEVEEDNVIYTSKDGVLFSNEMQTLICYPAGKTDATYSVPEGVITIGSDAFLFTQVTEVHIPASVETIGFRPFYWNRELTTITVAEDNPNYVSENGILYNKAKTELICCPAKNPQTSLEVPPTVKTIQNAAFCNNSVLTSVVLPASLEYVYLQAFCSCEKMDSVIFTGNVPVIEGNAFAGVTATVYYPCNDDAWTEDVMQNYGGALTWMKNHSFADSICEHCGLITGTCGEDLTWTLDEEGLLTISGTGAMTDYSNSESVPWETYRSQITTVEIKSGVTVIEDYAIFACDHLTFISIPASVTKFTLWSCSSLLEIQVDEENLWYRDVDGVLFDKNMSTLIWYPAAKNGETYAIPKTVTSIADEAFMLTRLTSVEIHDGVTNIGFRPFYWNSNLETITVAEGNPNYVSENGILYNKAKTELICCPAKNPQTSLEVPATVKTIQNAAFCNNSVLTSVVLPASLEYVHHQAFCSCEEMDSVIFMGDVPVIEGNAFAGVAAAVYYPCNDDSWTGNVLQNYGGTLTWKKSHTDGEVVVENEVEADCENAGSYDSVVYCTVCDNELSRETITVPATGHVDEDPADGECDNCGDREEAEVTCNVKAHTGDSTTEIWSINAEDKIINVQHTLACVVLIEHADGTYTRLTATANAEAGYDFDISAVEDGESIVIAVKGDINLDGELSGLEVGQIKAAQLGKVDTFTDLQNIIADVNGDGIISGLEVGQIKAAQLGKLNLAR